MTEFSIPDYKPFPLVDIGANLTHTSFKDDISSVIQRANTVGVTKLVMTGTSIEESHKAASLCQQAPNTLFSTAGIHPHDAKHFDPHSIEQLRAIAQQPAVRAIGECGLDFNRMFSTKEEQIKAFEAQIGLAIELQMPLFLHERDAHQCQLDILSSYQTELPPTVIHCFTGNKQQAYRYLDLNLYLGITGWVCDERRGLELQQLVGDIPLNRLMIETDSPYLMPRVKPKPRLKSRRRNEPCTLPYVLIEIARHSQIPIEDIAKATLANSLRFFSIPLI